MIAETSDVSTAPVNCADGAEKNFLEQGAKARRGLLAKKIMELRIFAISSDE